MPAADHDIEMSWALEPAFGYRAPVPANLPNGMQSIPFQHAGALYCVSRDHALIGDAPGLTKTAQSIMVGNAIEAKRALVICPASLRLNWEREIWAWSTIPNVTTYPVLSSADGIPTTYNYVIISWAALANPALVQAILGARWDHLILDEAHALKDPHGNIRTKACLGWHDKGEIIPGVVSVCGRITALSGTILPNQPIECYNLIRLLNWDAIDRASLDDFRNYYYGLGDGLVRGPVFNPKTGVRSFKLHWSNEVRNVPRHEDELQFRLRKHIMVRRLKEDAIKGLPAKIWHPFPLTATNAVKTALRHPGWNEATTLYEMDASAFKSGIPIDGAVSTARKLLGVAKAPLVADYIEDLFDSGIQKLVIGAWHHEVLDYLWRRLEKYGLVYMDGGTSTSRKQAAVDAFQRNEKVRGILGQQIPLGMGWTLTAAEDVVFAEWDWVPGNNDQLLDRIHRMGQTGHHVTGHVPVVPNTLEERIMANAIEKAVTIHKVLDKRT